MGKETTMNQQDAPLYVVSLDLSVWLHQHRVEEGSRAALMLWSDILLASRNLVVDIAQALTFPDARLSCRISADHGALRLKTLIPLAEELRILTARQRRFVMEQLLTIGRMIGGWRRRTRRATRIHNQGEEAPR